VAVPDSAQLTAGTAPAATVSACVLAALVALCACVTVAMVASGVTSSSAPAPSQRRQLRGLFRMGISFDPFPT
jgi:hypothetical protein